MEEIHFIDYNRIINIIHNQFTGRPLLKHCVETVMTNNGNFNIHTYKNDYDINTQVDLMIDEKLDQYIKSLSNDMIYHSDYDNKLKNLLNFKPVYTDDIHIEQINEVMVNYNYNLGFKINRDMLNNLIDGKYGFVSNYDNALVNNVTIELPYEEIYHYNKRKNKIPHHTFSVYHSGAITQSGPSISIMKGAYELFINTIEEIKDQIML